ncbi:hypothetical protein F7R15_16935 [Pseudomonas reinekei]|uniref:Uncharacterized protein n=1 Tax=Pseudomonas reinekei TaxID=395598 RepID=A0A6H9RJB0_PSERE|nr:hypothetical protein F7R15_16935 [Pseudomonas reinekei]
MVSQFPVGASLLAKAVGQSLRVLDVTKPSRAGSLPRDLVLGRMKSPETTKPPEGGFVRCKVEA